LKRGLLIYRINRYDPGNAGVVKKIKAQNKAFRKLGCKTDMIWLCKEGISLNEKLVWKKQLIPHSLSLYWFYFFHFAPLIQRLIPVEDYDFIYLRHPFFDPLLVRFFKKTKKKAPDLKIILEINTYPYDAEPKRFLHKFSLWMDQYYRKTAYKYIDRIVDYGQSKKIWNIPTINIRNGIDVDQISQSNSSTDVNKLRLIALGTWNYWHGLDRLILGLFNYYNDPKRGVEVTLKIVGTGKEIANYHYLVDRYELNNVIQFFPPTTGEKLDRYFDEADIGIGTLAMFRKGVQLDSSLKHREYCARGIPFIFGGKDPDFQMDCPFVNHFPNDYTALDIFKLIDFFELLKQKKPNYRNQMRVFAEERLSWNQKIQTILNQL
jgi:hypothetical protein